MNCTEFEKMLENYETLTDEEKLKLSEHAEQCDACSESLADYISMTEVLNSLPKLKAPEDFLSKLNERIDKEVPSQTGLWHNIKQHSYRYGAIAACIALVAVIGINNTELVDRMIGKDTNDAEVTVRDISDLESENTLPIVSGGATPTPEATTAPATTMPAVTSTQKPATARPLATAIPQSKQTKATSKPTTKPTAKPTAKPAEEKSTANTEVTEAPVNEQSFSATESTEAPAITDAPQIASVAMVDEKSETQTPILNPSEYELPDNDNSKSVRSASGYAHGAKNSIVVSYANAEIAKEIINEYSVAVNGDCYSVSKEAMEAFILAMNDAGIEIDQSSIHIEENVATFQLIIS